MRSYIHIHFFFSPAVFHCSFPARHLPFNLLSIHGLDFINVSLWLSLEGYHCHTLFHIPLSYFFCRETWKFLVNEGTYLKRDRMRVSLFLVCRVD